LVAASIAAFNQIADSAELYSRNGENSLQPSGPWKSAISRYLTDRKLFFTGIETTLSSNGNIN
jgi:hypothetical protein